jgi:hypothetical protein
MIITSMNLYEFSQQHNRETGILIEREKEEDRQVYDDAWKDIESIINNADDFSYVEAPKAPVAVKEEQVKKSTVKPELKQHSDKPTGYCIRTGEEMPFDLSTPMNAESFRSWNKFGNLDYPEYFCHFSGEASFGETSFERPILKKNWKKAKEVFGLK